MKSICFTVGWNHSSAEGESAHRCCPYLKEKYKITAHSVYSSTNAGEKEQFDLLLMICGI